jgi:hypothetical protein
MKLNFDLNQVALGLWYMIIFTVVIALVVLGLVFLTPNKPSTVGYECQWAEYPHAVDVPQAYIKACREARRIRE